MFSLLKKEINSFLGSLIGYVVIAVFLTSMGLFLWVFPNDMNVLNGGYASLNTLFLIAPWVFMFLIPAITMRLFADEKRSGTLELLLTKPLPELQLILGKYFASIVLILISLIPTLVYYYSVYQLGSPIGNIDSGATWGSLIGLLFLGSAFAAIGLFASSLTENQIVSFITAVFLSFICFVGFESVSTLSIFQGFDHVIQNIGINEHYISISRGVIDSRDVVYFVSISAVFLLSTKLVLSGRKW